MAISVCIAHSLWWCVPANPGTNCITEGSNIEDKANLKFIHIKKNFFFKSWSVQERCIHCLLHSGPRVLISKTGRCEATPMQWVRLCCTAAFRPGEWSHREDCGKDKEIALPQNPQDPSQKEGRGRSGTEHTQQWNPLADLCLYRISL